MKNNKKEFFVVIIDNGEQVIESKNFETHQEAVSYKNSLEMEHIYLETKIEKRYE